MIKKKNNLSLSFLAILISFTYSCKKNPTDTTSKENKPPTINVVNEIKTLPNESVSISANANDPNNDDLSYQWRLLKKPNSSKMDATLGSTSALNFSPDVVGNYKIELKVTDGKFDVKDTSNVTAQHPIGPEINEKTVLTDQYEYRVTETLTINAPLIIEPGTKVYVDSVDYDTQDEVIFIRTDYRGYISAQGTEKNPIIIKGLNNRPWAGITLSANNQKNTLANVSIENAINYDPVANPNVIEAYVPKAILDLRGGQASLKDVTIKKSKDTESLRTRLPIVSLEIAEDAQIEKFNQNSFDSNIALSVNHLSLLDNTFNLDGEIGLISASTDTVVLKNYGSKYRSLYKNSHWNLDSWSSFKLLELEKNVTLEINNINLPKSSALKMKEGSSLILKSGYLDIKGKIIAKGTKPNPISFTSVENQKGAWKGLRLYSSGNELDNVRISYAGAIPDDYNLTKASIGLYENSSLNISNSNISESSGWGIWVSSNSQLTDSNNVFQNCDLGTIGYEK